MEPQNDPSPGSPSTANAGRWRNGASVGRIVAVTAAASLVVGIIVGPIISGRSTLAVDTTGQPEHTVTVSGSGTVSVTPDVADVILGVSIQKPTVKEAQAAAGTAMAAVLAAVKKDGVDVKDIATINLSLNPVYDYSNSGSPRLTGQQFTNVVRVTVRHLDKIGAIVDDSVAAGATTIQGISFRVDDPKPLQAQARALAMADARSKADALTGAAGVSIKGVATISEVTGSVTPIYYAGAPAAMDKAAGTPIQTGTTDIQVQVTVSYLIG